MLILDLRADYGNIWIYMSDVVYIVPGKFHCLFDLILALTLVHSDSKVYGAKVLRRWYLWIFSTYRQCVIQLTVC